MLEVTTFSCHLAAELRICTQQPVLLIDLDIDFDSLAFALGLESSHSLASAIDNLSRLDRTLWEALVSRGPEGIDVLPSPAYRGERAVEELNVRQLVNRLSTYYSWIILDGGRLGPMSRSLLTLAHQVVLVTSPDVESLYQARQTRAEVLRAGVDDERTRVAVVDVKGPRSLPEAAVERALGTAPRVFLPPTPGELAEALNQRRLAAPSTRYRELIGRFARETAGLPEPTKSPSRLTQLLKMASPRP